MENKKGKTNMKETTKTATAVEAPQKPSVTREELVAAAEKAPVIWTNPSANPNKVYFSVDNKSNTKPSFTFPYEAAKQFLRPLEGEERKQYGDNGYPYFAIESAHGHKKAAAKER